MRSVARSDISAIKAIFASYSIIIMANMSRKKKKTNNRRKCRKKTSYRRNLYSRQKTPRQKQQDDIQETSSCGICLESLDNTSPSQLSDDFFCEHIFHLGCLDKWYRSTNDPSCPLCRRPIFFLQPEPPPPPAYTGPSYNPFPSLVKRKFINSQDP